MAKSLGETLDALLKQKNMSGRELAKKLGVSHKSVQEWLGNNGRMPRDSQILKKLAIIFDCSLHYLLLGEEDPKSIISNFLERTEIHTGLYEITVRKVSPKGK